MSCRKISVVLGLLVVAGCGGESPTSPEALAKPLEGKAPSKASQLVGTWFALNDGDFVGMEFMKDGKVLCSSDASVGMTLNYTVLEGGRLHLGQESGMTWVYEVTISGDQMELKGTYMLSNQALAQRFRRLKSGETIAQAQQAQRAAEAKAYQERVAALDSFLKQPGLVLAYTQGEAGAPGSMALEIQPAAGGFSGQAWHDGQPPRLNAISGQLHLDQASNSAQLLVTFGQRIAPPAAQPDGGGQITMNVSGEAKDLRIAAQVTFGDGSSTHELVLRPDKKLHEQIVGRYNAELARIEDLKKPLAALLKDYSVLRGQLQPQDTRQTQPDTADLVLARDPKSGQYYCQGVLVTGMRGRGELVAQAAAEIVVVNDQALLRIVCPPAREYLLSMTGESKLSGQWMTPGYGQGQGAGFDVVEALDAQARDARFDAQRQAIKSLAANAVFTGLAFEDSGFGLEMPISCRLELTVQPDGSVAGKAEYPSMATLMTVAGKLAEMPTGPRLELHYTAAESTPGDKIFFRSIQNGMWHLVPDDGQGPMKLGGYFTGPPLRTTLLTQVTGESKSHLRQRVVEAMAQDGRFYLARVTSWQVPGQTPTVVQWKLDDATSAVTGQILSGGRPIGANEKVLTTYEGKIAEQGDWVVVNLTQTSHWKENDKFVTGLELMASEDATGGLYLTGPTINIGRVQNGQRVSEAAPARDYPVGFIPVGATDAEAHAAIDQALAAVEQAKADAAAAAQAQATAALDARQAKMARFYPAFKNPGGAVITTDAPAEMGAVILQANVDEQNATITGKGIDLREMPFREFTFETGLDAWGNLTVTTSLSKTPYAFNAAADKGLTGRYMALTPLSEADRAKIDDIIRLGQRLQSAAPVSLTVQTLDAATAKAREANLQAGSLPGIAIYKERKNDQVAAMFTARSNGRFRWIKEPVSLRLTEPTRGQALYIKGSGPTDNLTVVVNGVHRATIPAIAQLGAAVVSLPSDLDILDIRLQAGGTAQARGVVLLPSGQAQALAQ